MGPVELRLLSKPKIRQVAIRLPGSSNLTNAVTSFQDTLPKTWVLVIVISGEFVYIEVTLVDRSSFIASGTLYVEPVTSGNATSL